MRRFFAVLLMPILLLSGTASAYSLYRCHYDQVARRACCCPGTNHDSAASDAQHTATIEKNCCCDLETVTTSHTPSEATPVQPVQAVAPLLAAILPFPTQVFTAIRHAPLLAEQPRGVGPPIIILKCSFQI